MVKLSVCPVGRCAPLGLRGLRSLARASERDLQLGPIPSHFWSQELWPSCAHPHPPAVGFHQNPGSLH